MLKDQDPAGAQRVLKDKSGEALKEITYIAVVGCLITD
jgi:hypothetical protein